MFREDDPRDQNADAQLDRVRGEARSDGPFSKHLALPDGRDRELVDGYRLRGSEVRILATVGAFRVVPRGDLERHSVATARELDRLRQEGLVSTTPYMIGRQRTTVVSLTREGLELLEHHRRDCGPDEHQSFYSGVARVKELSHDSRLYAAYREAHERLTADGAKVRRVVLEVELKREYQRFLQEPNRGLSDSAGLPRRDRDGIAKWASERGLPVIRGSVRFPDLRIEYESPDGTAAREDVEIVTENYRGSHAASTAAAGFKCQRVASTRVGGARSSAKGARPRDGRLAEEMLR